jgi:hypothetical protein
MKKYNCPSCAAEVVFTSNVSVYAVCKYCTSMVVRHDMDVESIGKMAVLPEDSSPFQIGTEGICSGVRFALIGRMKIGWTDGSWNEWFFVTDSGKKGWLAEAQGFYALSFELEKEFVKALEHGITNLTKSFITSVEKRKDYRDSLELDVELKRRSIPTGAYIDINKKRYKLVDVKEAECIGSEGELPLYAKTGRKSISMDFVAGNGEFASIELHNSDIRVFTGIYAEWDDLKCSNHREFDWPLKVRSKS